MKIYLKMDNISKLNDRLLCCAYHVINQNKGI